MKAIFFITGFLICITVNGQGKFYGGNGDGFASAAVSNVVLPVNWTAFSGKVNGRVNMLFWKTASETNNKLFEVERSGNAIQFEKIGQVPGAGNSSTIRQYQFIDDKLLAPAYYYRLRQIDDNGRSTFSNIIFLRSKTDNQQIIIFPNPAVNSITVLFQHLVINKEFLLLNSNGQLICKLCFNGMSGNIDLTGKAAGVYLLSNKELGITVRVYKVKQ